LTALQQRGNHDLSEILNSQLEREREKEREGEGEGERERKRENHDLLEILNS
jgi:hypothetical protein